VSAEAADLHAAAPKALVGARVQPLSPALRRYAMSLLLAISMINYLDRYVINILAEPIKRDLGLADWQLGLMTGLAFGMLYTVLGLPIARLAERTHRPLIIAVSAGIWSVFTLLCGVVQSFWQLALLRVGVGIGEAGCTPPAFSLIVDYAPPEKRSSALAFYGLGSPFGALLGMVFGGLVADAYGWRAAFLLAGAPGILFAFLALFSLPEPRRALKVRAAQVKATSASLSETVRHLVAKRSYRVLGAAMVLKMFVSWGVNPFMASFFFRNHAQQLDEAARAAGQAWGFSLGSVGFLGIVLGLTNGVAAALGTWSGGKLADRFSPVDLRRYVQGPAISESLAIPIFLAAMFTGDLWLSLGLYALYAFTAALWYGPAFAAAMSITPSHMRATSTALLLLASNLVGLGLSPLAVGLVSDALHATYGAGDGLRLALAALALMGVFTAILFWMSSRTLREDLEP
jgi:MFS family permease